MSADPKLVERCVTGFRAAYGRAPDRIAFAPGRVNLIGEHTDYNDGFVLPCALPFGTVVAMARREDARVNAAALDLGLTDAFDLDAPVRLPDGEWANHVRGVVAGLPHFGLGVRGADIAIAGDAPQGAGLSSSASLGVAAGLALAGEDANRQALARTAQWSEHNYAGCACGIMDQLASACGIEDRALLIDCRSLELRAVPLPENATVMIVHCGIARELADSAYNERRSQCEAAARHYGVRALRDLDAALLDGKADGLDATAWRRARHVVTENARTLRAADAMARGDLATLGKAMRESHASMRDDFEITTPEIDALVEAMARAIGDAGGARMTGGGFGGCVVAVFDRAATAAVDAALNAYWQSAGRSSPLQLRTTAARGAHLLS